ncbi:Hypothetical protein CINCED_3A012097 [Cinara cedri]|uniref:Reverse transcriptase domain n=1 Tax=Cinara cedri TaxID=506608 RepID=A0A5E4M8J6_9HEMI|nr:Hypothetical protein CINCED_3A012097 [Cinara cedri]
MICSKQNEPNINISIKGKRMEQINQFKYLGSIIDNEGRSKKEIKSRIGSKYGSYVWSTALYGCETRTLNKKEETTLKAFEMWCWRKMEKIKWTELKTNEEVLDLVKEKRTLLNNLRSRRWHIIGHTLRHNEEFHSLIMEGMVEGKRGRGRPRTCYISQIIKDARVDSYKQLKEKAQDRESRREHLL